jgi:hypothetical protein
MAAGHWAKLRDWPVIPRENESLAAVLDAGEVFAQVPGCLGGADRDRHT